MNTVDPITATYVHDDADWTVTVSGLGKELTDRAPGIIAARDRADQLVDRVAPERDGRTVVHLLNGSAFDFTAAYIEARLTRSAPPAASNGAAGRHEGAGGDAGGADRATTPETQVEAPETSGAPAEAPETPSDRPAELPEQADGSAHRAPSRSKQAKPSKRSRPQERTPGKQRSAHTPGARKGTGVNGESGAKASEQEDAAAVATAGSAS